MVLRKTKLTRLFWILFILLGLYNSFLAGLNISNAVGMGANNYLMGALFALGICLFVFVLSFISKAIYKFCRDDGKQLSFYYEALFFAVVLIINVLFRLGMINLNSKGVYGSTFSFDFAISGKAGELFNVSGCSYVYAKIVALIASIFGTTPMIGNYIQLFFHVVIVFVLYFTVKILMGTFAAIYSALLYSILPYNIISVTRVDEEMLYTCLLISSIGLISYVCYQSSKLKIKGASGFSMIAVAGAVGGFTAYLDKSGLLLILLAYVMLYLYRNKEAYNPLAKFKTQFVIYVIVFIISFIVVMSSFAIIENIPEAQALFNYFSSFTNIQFNPIASNVFLCSDHYGIYSISLLVCSLVWLIRYFYIERDHGSFLIILPTGLSILSILSLSNLSYIGTECALWSIIGGMGIISLGKNSLLFLDAEEANKEFEKRKNKEKREKAKQELIALNLEKNKENQHHAVYRLDELPVLDKNSDKRISKVSVKGKNINISGALDTKNNDNISELEASLEFLHPELVPKKEETKEAEKDNDETLQEKTSEDDNISTNEKIDTDNGDLAISENVTDEVNDENKKNNQINKAVINMNPSLKVNSSNSINTNSIEKNAIQNVLSNDSLPKMNSLDSADVSDINENDSLIEDPNKMFGTIKFGQNNINDGVKIVTNNNLGPVNTPISSYVKPLTNESNEQEIKSLPPLAKYENPKSDNEEKNESTEIKKLKSLINPDNNDNTDNTDNTDISKDKKYKTVVEFGHEYVIEIPKDDNNIENEMEDGSNDDIKNDSPSTSDFSNQIATVNENSELNKSVNSAIIDINETDVVEDDSVVNKIVLNNSDDIIDENVSANNIESNTEVLKNLKRDDTEELIPVDNLDINEVEVIDVINNSILETDENKIVENSNYSDSVEMVNNADLSTTMSNESNNLDDSIPILNRIYSNEASTTDNIKSYVSDISFSNEIVNDTDSLVLDVKDNIVNDNKENLSEDGGDELNISGNSNSGNKKINTVSDEDILNAKKMSKPAIPPVQSSERPNIPTNKFGKRMDYKTAVVSRNENIESSILSDEKPIKPNTLQMTTIQQKVENKPIHNPLPIPKKHVPKEQNFDIELEEDDLHFDLVDLNGKDFFDIN